jgi:hypothetical protein
MQQILLYLVFTGGINSSSTGSAEFNTIEACQAAAAVVLEKSVSWEDAPSEKLKKQFKDMGIVPWAECVPKGKSPTAG